VKSTLKIVKHRDFDFEKVRFYTVKFEGDKQNQLDQFFSTYESEYAESIEFLLLWLTIIGETRGATTQYFRPEENVSALPPPAATFRIFDYKIKKTKTNLRLYCIVLSEEVVILINGGIKESHLTQDSPSCWKQYMFTSNLASQIKAQFQNGNCELIGKRLKMNRNFSLTYTKK